MKIRVLIAVQNGLFGQCMRLAIVEQLDHPEITICDSAEAALCAVRDTRFDVVLLDTETADLDGLDYVPAVMASKRARHTVVLVGRKDVRSVARLRRLGCDALIDAHMTNYVVFGHALRSVLAGRRFISPNFLDPVIANSKAAQYEELSSQEEITLSILGCGTDNDEAATHLGACPDTVRGRRERLMKRFGVHHKGALIHYAAVRGYVRFVGHRALHPGLEIDVARAQGCLDQECECRDCHRASTCANEREQRQPLCILIRLIQKRVRDVAG